MDEENIISKTHNQCEELFQWWIQGTRVVSRPKRRNKPTTGVHDRGAQEKDRTNNPQLPDRKNIPRVKTLTALKTACKIHCSRTGKLMFPSVSLLYLLCQSLIWERESPAFVCFRRARHTTCCCFLNAYHQISPKSLVNLFLVQNKPCF